MRGVLVLASLALLAGCGAQPEDPQGPPADAVGAPAGTDLRVVVDRGDGTEPETYTLACDGEDGSTHPDPEAACAHLGSLDEPFAPLPADVVCTEQYGGPETASIVGRWDGGPVDVELSRTDGCRIAQWDALGPVLPAP